MCKCKLEWSAKFIVRKVLCASVKQNFWVMCENIVWKSRQRESKASEKCEEHVRCRVWNLCVQQYNWKCNLIWMTHTWRIMWKCVYKCKILCNYACEGIWVKRKKCKQKWWMLDVLNRASCGWAKCDVEKLFVKRKFLVAIEFCKMVK